MLRVAEWPIESLSGFGDPDLFDAVCEGHELGELEARYEAALARERVLLWERTVLDPAFMKALAMANPSLCRKVQDFTRRHPEAWRSPRNKRTRHLETTLVRLLARAAGRTEPFGAWCGVGVAVLGEVTRVSITTPTRFVAPNLAFFVDLLSKLEASRPEVRRAAARYRLNPTLGRQEDGSWAYWAPPPETAKGRGTLASDPALDKALEHMQKLDVFSVEDLERALGAPDGVLDAFLVEQLIPAGVVIGGIPFPVFFRDPWDALEQIRASVGPHLGAQSHAFASVVDKLRAISAEVASTYEVTDVDALLSRIDEVEALGVELARGLGVEGLRPLTLSMDSASAFEMTLGPDLVADLRAAIDADEADKTGDVRAFNERLRRVQCELLRDGVPLANVTEESIADLDEVAAHDAIAETDYFPEWPLRTVLVPLLRGAEQEPVLGPTMLLDDAAASFSRFIPCLTGASPTHAEELVSWLRRTHESFGPPRLAALGATSVDAPNAAAQPDLGLPRYSLWSVEPSLAGARISAIAERGLVTIEARDGAGEPLAIVPLSAVNVASHDPILKLLLMSSMRFPRPWAKPRAEEQPPRATRLKSKVVGLDRFVDWCLTHRALPRGHVMVHRAATSPLCMPLTSPLAVSALLEGVSEDESMIIVPIESEPYLEADGARYVAQLVLAFRSS